MSRFGDILRESRKRVGLSQGQLAAQVDVDASYISKIETGVLPPPSREVALKLTGALGITERAEQLSFLLAAKAASDEDLEGFELLQVASGKTSAEKPPVPVQSIRLGLAHAAKALPVLLEGTTGERIESLIAAARLSEKEEEQVAAALVEITKQLLNLIAVERGEQ